MFQSLIGIRRNCNASYGGLSKHRALFQSLIGIRRNCNRRHLKRLPYLVFEVQLRESVKQYGFQTQL